MCLIKVRPEIEEEVIVPARRVNMGGSGSRHGSIRHGSRGSRLQDTTTTTTVVKAPPPPPPGSGLGSTTVIHTSPRASGISASRDFFVDAYPGRSPRSSYRYFDSRGSSHRIEGPSAGKEVDYVRRDHYDYNNFHGRRSGSVNYVPVPRRSAASHRSGREKVVVVDEFGREQYY